MKVLHLRKGDPSTTSGGGAVSMYRLHCGLRSAGVNSRILCQEKTSDSPHVDVLVEKPTVKKVEQLLKKFTSRLGLNDIHQISSFGIKNNPAFVDADLIHFHGIHSDFINYLALPNLTTNKPAVFTLKDMWALTGHCIYSYDCERWQIGCGKCPYPNSYPAIKRDNTHLEWRLKDWAYRQSNLTLICPSKWMTELAQKSPLTNRFPIHHIPHGINTEVFQPLDLEKTRSQLGIPVDKKVLLFVAANVNNYRKGGDLLIKSLQKLPASLQAETVILVMGKGDDNFSKTVDMPVHHLGFLSDDYTKALAYAAADLFLFPTRADNFPNVALESIACGTPVISFKVGGVGDHVRPNITGYLAEPENTDDFCNGIVQLLEDETLRQQISQQCRAIALQEYNIDLYVQRHLDLYQELTIGY